MSDIQLPDINKLQEENRQLRDALRLQGIHKERGLLEDRLDELRDDPVYLQEMVDILQGECDALRKVADGLADSTRAALCGGRRWKKKAYKRLLAYDRLKPPE